MPTEFYFIEVFGPDSYSVLFKKDGLDVSKKYKNRYSGLGYPISVYMDDNGCTLYRHGKDFEIKPSNILILTEGIEDIIPIEENIPKIIEMLEAKDRVP